MKYIFPWILFGLLPFISCHKDTTGQPADSLSIPEADTWWNNDVFYEIFVRSFYDSNGDGIGDFKGITEKLDYLNDGNPNTSNDLGITAIWLMPIYPSPSYHGYDITDYRNVNPQYGTMDDFKHLLSEAHKRGIKIIIDFVINHTSDQHPWFVNSSSAPNSEKRDWYVWKSYDPGYKGPWGQTVWYEKGGSYYYGLFWSGMPDLNYRNKLVTAEVEDIARYWYENVGVDGFRMDAAMYLIEDGQNQVNTDATKNWWRNFYAFQKNLSPGLMSVGEVWTNTAQVVPYADKRLDYCFEFDLASAIIAAAKYGDPTALKSKIMEVIDSYPKLQYGTFLTNHDQDRVMNDLGGNTDMNKLAAGILLTLPGVPYIYYGEEIGQQGVKPDEDIRRPMQWSSSANAGFTTGTPWRAPDTNYTTVNVSSEATDSTSLWNYYRKLIHIRSSSDALKLGEYTEVTSSDPRVMAYLRTTASDAVLVIHNLGSQASPGLKISVSGSPLTQGNYQLIDKLSGGNFGTLTVTTGGGFAEFTPSVEPGPMTTCILELSKK